VTQQSGFLKEISEQPEAVRDLVAHYRGAGATSLELWTKMAASIGRVVFAGMGTSEFVAESVAAEMTWRGVDSTTIDAGELLHYRRPIKGMLALISQSGESVETRKLAEREPSAAVLAGITNNPKSTIARAASIHLPICAGVEGAISTKTYVNQLALLHLMSKSLGAAAELESAFDDLSEVADAMPNYDSAGIQAAADLISDAQAIHFIARGPAMASARQAALTFMEGTHTYATAFAGGAFRHGPFEMIGDDHRCVFFIPGGRTFELLRSMAVEVAEKGSHVVAITDQEIDLGSPNTRVLKVPSFGEDVFPICAATTQELLLDAVASRRGVRAGEFRYGGKVTLRE
jgi:glutamine---fructose-6-phosphate transaminase (isomerizing)